MQDTAEGGVDDWRKGHARLNRTVAAFIDRGMDHRLAQTLSKRGWTLAKLKQTEPAELSALGLSDGIARKILSGRRPPIPFNELAAALIASRFTCCVCHDPQKSVVIHHIEDWAQSRDHTASNLAVLCLDHHDKAHKQGGHTRNLTHDLVHQAKHDWEAKVAKLDTRAILDASAIDSDVWWLFNHIRLFSLASDLMLDLSRVEGFAGARDRALIDNSGVPRARPPHTSWMYQGGDGSPLYRYVTGVLRATLSHLTVYNISDDLDRSTLSSIVRPDQFLFLQGTFNFQTRGVAALGPGQTVVGVRHVNGVKVSFTADRWEAVSNSAWSNWLKGRREIACALRVINVTRSEGMIHIETTAIAISAPLGGLKTREYANAPYRQGYYPDDDVEPQIELEIGPQDEDGPEDPADPSG